MRSKREDSGPKGAMVILRPLGLDMFFFGQSRRLRVKTCVCRLQHREASRSQHRPPCLAFGEGARNVKHHIIHPSQKNDDALPRIIMEVKFATRCVVEMCLPRGHAICWIVPLLQELLEDAMSFPPVLSLQDEL